MATRSSIDLSRRRVAAISFLANISTDDAVTEIRLDCLQGTQVLRDFQRKKRDRLRRLEAMRRAEKAAKEEAEEAENAVRSPLMSMSRRRAAAGEATSRQQQGGRLPKKLTFGQSESAALFVDETEDPQEEEEEEDEDDRVGEEVDVVPPWRKSRSHVPSAPVLLSHSVSNASAAAIENHDNLLHLDLSKTLDVQQQQQQPKSAPIHSGPNTFQHQQLSSTTSSSSKSNLHFDRCVNNVTTR